MPQSGSRKLSLSPYQREVLWLLREVGAESLPKILVELQAQFQNRTPEQLLSVIEVAVRDLWRLGLISLDHEITEPHWHYVPIPPEQAKEFLELRRVPTIN